MTHCLTVVLNCRTKVQPGLQQPQPQQLQPVQQPQQEEVNKFQVCKENSQICKKIAENLIQNSFSYMIFLIPLQEELFVPSVIFVAKK